jgi:hypothetical protein
VRGPASHQIPAHHECRRRKTGDRTDPPVVHLGR